jgi:hypothetical protein
VALILSIFPATSPSFLSKCNARANSWQRIRVCHAVGSHMQRQQNTAIVCMTPATTTSGTLPIHLDALEYHAYLSSVRPIEGCQPRQKAAFKQGLHRACRAYPIFEILQTILPFKPSQYLGRFFRQTEVYGDLRVICLSV